MDLELSAEEYDLIQAWRESDLPRILRLVADSSTKRHLSTPRRAHGRIFACWSTGSANSDEALRELEKVGYPLWVHRNVNLPGVLLERHLRDGVHGSAGVAVFVDGELTHWQLAEIRYAAEYGRALFPAVLDGGVDRLPGELSRVTVGLWKRQSMEATLFSAFQASGLCLWMERQTAKSAAVAQHIEDIVGVTQAALADASPADARPTVWFPDSKRSVKQATWGMQFVAWQVMVDGRSQWVEDLNLEELTLEQRAQRVAEALLEGADPRYRGRFEGLLRCGAQLQFGLVETVRTFAMVRL